MAPRPRQLALAASTSVQRTRGNLIETLDKIKRRGRELQERFDDYKETRYWKDEPMTTRTKAVQTALAWVKPITAYVHEREIAQLGDDASQGARDRCNRLTNNDENAARDLIRELTTRENQLRALGRYYSDVKDMLRSALSAMNRVS